MSILNNTDIIAPVAKIRSFFFSFLIMGQILLSFPITVMADEVTSEDSSPAEESHSATFSQNIFHQHTGSSSGGGCYSLHRTGSRTEEYPCRGTMVYFAEYDKTQCNKCGAGYFGDQSGRDCWHSETKTVSYSYYDLGCGKSPSTLLGSITVMQSTTEWTKSLLLSASYSANGMAVTECPFSWNGGAATAESTYEVTANGNYSLRLHADGNANTAAAVVNIPIRNIDVTAPAVSGHSLTPMDEWTKEGVVMTLGEVYDLQPDGSQGCGLHELPYSYDNGQTWVEENQYLYTENGTHTILVRDALENVTSYDISFSNVDMTPPTVTGIGYDDTKNIRTTLLSVSANDIQPDGSKGSGLHEKPYSFDGGVTWTDIPDKQIDSNGTVTVAVRDKLENVVVREIVITNIDCYAPLLSYEMKQDSWTNEDVKLYLRAEDRNADGSSGIGLADNWYSLDGGSSFSNKDVIVFENNCEFSVITRDKHDNRSYTDISIRQIDKDSPWVILRMEVIGEGRDMQVRLIADAGDAYSGLPEEAYSWDKGCSYGKEPYKTVTENGSYQITVRDKAGNWDYDILEVDVFKEEIPVPITEKVKEPEEESSTMEAQTDEPETTEIPEPVAIKAEKAYERPQPQTVAVAQKGWGLREWMILAAICLAILVLLFLLLFFLLRTVLIFAENAKGNMEFVGISQIRKREERYEVHFTELVLEQCVTTHFLLRPGCLFVTLHKDAQLSCLFPEDICLTVPVQKEMDFSLL